MELRRQNAANQPPTRGSERSFESRVGSATTYSTHSTLAGAGSRGVHMVLSFNIQNGLPSLPTRKCATNGDRRDKAVTARAEVAITGLAIVSSTKPAARSATSATQKPRAEEVSSTQCLRIGSKLMVDTANAAPEKRSLPEYRVAFRLLQAIYNMFAFLLQGAAGELQNTFNGLASPRSKTHDSRRELLPSPAPGPHEPSDTRS